MSSFDGNTRQTYVEALIEKLNQYKDTSKASEWLESNKSRVQALFENERLRDVVFEPFKEVFRVPAKTVDADIYSVITQVAVINAVLAGIPGRMGVGVYIVMAMEGWMAIRIARHLGIDVTKTSDIWQYFGVLAASVGVILYAFRTLLGLAFSLFSLIPVVNPLIFAEFFVTDFVGTLFLIGFSEAKTTGSFSVPKRMLLKAGKSSSDLFKHQYRIIKNVLSLQNIRTVATNVANYLRGELPTEAREFNGEIFATAALGYLIAGHHEKLEGPISQAFLDAIRLRWSEKLGPDATLEYMAELFRGYDPEELQGAMSVVKGKMFEILVTERENQDSDPWVAKMHTDESFPGSDVVFTNPATGEQLEVSLKALSSASTQLIESAIARYPDIPILTTSEAAALYEENGMVFDSGISDDGLQDITQDNLNALLGKIDPLNQYEVLVGGMATGKAAALWPFTVAYLRGKITKEQLVQACVHVLGGSGKVLASRLGYASLFGPAFAWYLLAKGVKGIVESAEPKNRYLVEFV